MCINPKSRTCDCDACLDERIHVSGMRNRALYNGYTNPLAQWLASEEWTEPNSIFTMRDSNGHTYRGTDIILHDSGETSGEITC